MYDYDLPVKEVCKQHWFGRFFGFPGHQQLNLKCVPSPQNKMFPTKYKGMSHNLQGELGKYT